MNNSSNGSVFNRKYNQQDLSFNFQTLNFEHSLEEPKLWHVKKTQPPVDDLTSNVKNNKPFCD